MSTATTSPAQTFEDQGYYITDPIIPPELTASAINHMDAVIAGNYETGTAPHSRRWHPGDPPNQLCKIDQPHLSDHTIYKIISHTAIGQWAAKISNANFIQVWAVQLLHKPPGGSTQGNIGWHQDMQHWKTWWQGEVFTAWLALTDIHPNSGPMRFVHGSHKWGLNPNPSFFFSEHDHQTQQNAIPKPNKATWQEIPALLQAGSVSYHHRFTYHGSGPNTTTSPRRSFAIHLRTEKSTPLDGNNYYTDHLNDEAFCPIIYQR